MNKSVCWLEGEVLPLEKACIPVLDHGLLYGDGVFEGVRFYRGWPFLPGAHLRRLRRSARAISLEYPWSDAELGRIMEQVVAAFGEPEGYLRLIVTRGEGPLGIDPAACRTPRLIVIAARLQMVDHAGRETGVRLVTASTRRLPPDGLDPRIKSLNYLNSVLARLEANRAGADEAVLLNVHGRVAEGTADNLFIVQDGVLVTPPVTDGALPGITRDLVMELAREGGITTREHPLTTYDLHTAEECFLTGTGTELVPVREIDGRSLDSCPGPVYRHCAEAFLAAIERSCGGVQG